MDTIGDLMGIYKKSKVAFVGGSLAPYGGQNILEPLFFATPVVFGPYMENFEDIAHIVLERRAGMMADNGNDLYKVMKKIFFRTLLCDRRWEKPADSSFRNSKMMKKRQT